MIKVSDLKKDFPIFEREINGKRLTYLDTKEFLNNNQHRVYNNKKLCEELLWKGKSLIIKLIDEILQKK